MLDTAPNAELDATNHRPRRQPRSTPMPRSRFWAVVQTYPQGERWADTNIRRRGYVTYLPLLAVRRRDPVVRSMHHVVEQPLFPGYLMVQLADADPWTPVRYAPGVARLLMADGRPQALPPGLCEALQAGESARRSLTPAGENWAPGAPCRASGGAFAGVDAVVLAVSGQKATIALPLLGGLREVSVPTEWLVARE